ncbi:hypothetical protein J6590_000732, partial [Homalodisca vitripennis]
SELAPTVRPLSGLQKMPAGVKNARFFGNFFEGLKMKNSHFSGFSWWLHVESYLCTKFQVSNSSGSRLELVYVSEEQNKLPRCQITCCGYPCMIETTAATSIGDSVDPVSAPSSQDIRQARFLAKVRTFTELPPLVASTHAYYRLSCCRLPLLSADQQR